MRMMRDVILCRDCGLRRTLGCPMHAEEMVQDETGITIRAWDKTTDYGFCHMGALKQDDDCIRGSWHTPGADEDTKRE